MGAKSDHDLLIEVHTCLLGTNGQRGLCQDFESLKKDHYVLKRLVIGLLCFLLGTGAIEVWRVLEIK